MSGFAVLVLICSALVGISLVCFVWLGSGWSERVVRERKGEWGWEAKLVGSSRWYFLCFEMAGS